LTVCAIIFARGGSKGVPRKNIRLFAGKPLIAYAIETGLEADLIDRVFVSTDDPEIAEISTKHGAEVPFLRPKELARDDSAEWHAWRHAIEFLQERLKLKLAAFVSLPPTAPLRTDNDVNRCIQTFFNRDADIVITVKKAHRHPAFNMVRIDRQGVAHLVMPPGKPIVTRQQPPPLFDMTTVAYVAKPEFVLKADSIFSGKVAAVTIPEERAVDIDTPFDFEFAEFLMFRREKAD